RKGQKNGGEGSFSAVSLVSPISIGPEPHTFHGRLNQIRRVLFRGEGCGQGDAQMLQSPLLRLSGDDGKTLAQAVHIQLLRLPQTQNKNPFGGDFVPGVQQGNLPVFSGGLPIGDQPGYPKVQYLVHFLHIFAVGFSAFGVQDDNPVNSQLSQRLLGHFPLQGPGLLPFSINRKKCTSTRYTSTLRHDIAQSSLERPGFLERYRASSINISRRSSSRRALH